MHCAFCRSALGYVHGHAACLDGRCPMFGQNQAECCSGDTGDCLPTSVVAAGPARVSRMSDEAASAKAKS
jgi:hypothetical protein